MNLLLVESWPFGGTARYAAELATSLAAQEPGADVNLLVPDGFADTPPGVRIHPRLPEIHGGDGALPLRVARILGSRRAQARAVDAVVRHLRPDVVHLLGTARLAHPQVRPVVRTVHDLPLKHRGLAARLTGLSAKALRSPAMLIVHGDWSRDGLLAEFSIPPSRVTVIPHGAYDYGPASADRVALRQRLGIPEHVPLVLFFGAIRSNKGLDDLLGALLEPAARGLHLLAAGERSARSERTLESYREQAEEMGLGPRTHWLPRYVPDGEVADVFAMADALALPYKRDFRGQSGVLAIAATHGVPVVTTRVGELGDAVERLRLGLVVPPDDRTALAEAIERACTPGVLDPAATRAYAEQTSWQKVAGLHWELYRRLRDA